MRAGVGVGLASVLTVDPVTGSTEIDFPATKYIFIIPRQWAKLKVREKERIVDRILHAVHGSQCPGKEDSRDITIPDAMHVLYSGRDVEKTLDSQNRICIRWHS